MSLVLYRKYRPTRFDDVVGQDHVVRTLQNAAKHERVAHAYLFAGPRGTGKTTLARLLAKAINCESLKGAEPCQACEYCEEVTNGSFLDLIEIDAASNRGIDEIRELREQVRFAPSKGRYKVFIIDEVHMLTREAFNALLKTLEEPPAHVVFILATTEPHKVPATILSRVQRFDFRRIAVSVIAKRLASIAASEEVEIDEPARELIALYAGGGMRDAESMLGQLIASGVGSIGVDDVRAMLGIVDHAGVAALMDAFAAGDAPTMLRTIHNIMEEGQDLRRFADEMMRYLRSVRMLQESEDLEEIVARDIAENALDSAKRHVQTLSSQTVDILLTRLMDATASMGSASIVQLPLELALLTAFHAVSQTPQREISSPKENKEGDDERIESSVNGNDEEQSELSPTVTRTIDPGDELTVDAVRGAWGSVLEGIRPYNNALHAFLQAADIKEIADDNTLHLAVRYDFHKERLAVPQHRKTLLGVLQKALGRKVTVEVTVEPDEAGANNVVSSAIKALGGRLVK